MNFRLASSPLHVLLRSTCPRHSPSKWRKTLWIVGLLVMLEAVLPSQAFFSWPFQSRRSSSASCIDSGGGCQSALSCFLSMGVVTSGCGFLNVCCEQPYSANRYIRDNHPPYPEESISVRQVRNHPVDDYYGQVINDPQCGRPDSYTANRRVLDGQPAGFGSFPWQALIRIGKGKCGGVLINRRHIVTAGHCVKNKPLGRILVTLGEYHLKRAEPLPGQNFRVIRAVVHPKFQFSPAADRYDVAVLTLNRPANYAPHISPICLPEAGRDPEPGTTAYVAGWGALIPDDITGPLIQILVPEIKRPSVLQVVNVPVLENDRCESWHQNAGIKVQIWPEMVCAGYRQGGKDSCKGDSGGPLMVQQADGRWVLIGLVSAGFSCGKPGQPGIYHRISSTSDWITYQAYGHRYYK